MRMPGVEPGAAGILGIDGVHAGQGDQEQTHADGDRGDGDDQTNGRLFPPVEGETQAEPDHDTTRSGDSEAGPAVPDDDLPIGVGGDPRLVGDQHDRGAVLAGGGDQQLHDVLAGERVQRPRRLVRKEDLGAGDQAASQRHPLGLPTGELAGASASSPSEAQLRQPAPRLPQGLGPPDTAEQQRQGHILLRRQFGNELTELEHETEVIPSQRTALLLAQGVVRRPSKRISPRSGRRMPARQCRRVDLPEPLGPITARISPVATATLAPRRAGVAPNER